jgi:hypothetical protein
MKKTLSTTSFSMIFVIIMSLFPVSANYIDTLDQAVLELMQIREDMMSQSEDTLSLIEFERLFS